MKQVPPPTSVFAELLDPLAILISQVTETGTVGEPAEAGRERMRGQTPLRTPAPRLLAACAPSQLCPTVSSSPFTWARESATKGDPTHPKGQQCHGAGTPSASVPSALSA